MTAWTPPQVPIDALQRARDPLAFREAFHERAGIYEFEAGLPRLEAELRALRDLAPMLVSRSR